MLKTQPMAPALYVAALCLLGLVIGLFLLRADRRMELNSRKPRAPEAI
jgi:hypothetical protein